MLVFLLIKVNNNIKYEKKNLWCIVIKFWLYIYKIVVSVLNLFYLCYMYGYVILIEVGYN